MKLPIIPKKQFELKSKYLPKGKITLSPFTVGLESLLVQVKDTEDPKEKLEAIKQVIQGCIQTRDIDVEALPLFMIEEIFLRLRQNSVGEIVEQSYQCTNELGDEKLACNNVMPIQIDLREFVLVEEAGHTNTILVSDPIGIKFKYPNISMFDETQGAGTSTNDLETIIGCIDSIFDAEVVYPAQEHTREQLVEFWEQLTLPQKKDVFDKFFQSMPHLHYKKALVCSKCGHNHSVEFNSVQEVFQ